MTPFNITTNNLSLSLTSKARQLNMSKAHHTQDSPAPAVLYAVGCSIEAPPNPGVTQPSGQGSFMSSDDEQGRIFARPFQQQDKKKSRRPSPKAPAPAQSAPTMVQASSASIDLEKDGLAPEGLLLCPFRLVKQYPYKYVGTMNRQKVQEFFENNLFKGTLPHICINRFYIHDPCSKRAPLLLVPTADFEEFLHGANQELRTLLAIPNGSNSENFNLGFDGCPRPQFAGKVETEDAYYALQTKLAQSNHDYSYLQPAALGFFKQEMDNIYESVKRPKMKKDPAAQRAKMIAKQKGFSQTTKRVQRYLGLRTRTAYTHGKGSNPPGPGMSLPRLTVFSADKKWNISLPPPFKTEWDVRFVCIDVEAHEFNNKDITEVGIAILDTQDIVGIAPGVSGMNWFTKIQAHHLRIKEVAHLVNRRFVKGCPEYFDFGESEIVPGMNIVKRLESIVGTGDNNESPIVLVGHDLAFDMKYLRDLGFNLWRSPLFLDEVDTQNMFQRVQRDPKSRKLAVMCNELGTPGRNFHNAGNDAMYTLRAMVTMAVLRKTGYPEIVSTTEDPREIPRYAEWTDGEDEDGGTFFRSLEPGE
ncbi:hypothetical protein PG995_000484, partial [Apiospora arundinis]